MRRVYADACAEGLLPGCTRLGMLFSEGRLGHPARADSARHYLALACGAGRDTLAIGDAAACTHLGRMFVGAAGAGAGAFPVDSIAAVENFWAGCALLDPEACAELAYYGFQSGRVPGPAALLRAATACEEGSGYGCYTAGWLYTQDFSADPAQVVRYYQRACCRLNDGPACSELARYYQESDPDATQMDIIKYARRGCALGDGDGCMHLADDLLMFIFPPAQSTEYEAAYQAQVSRACDAGSADGCWEMMYFAAEAGDEVEAGLYRTRACALDPADCKQKR